MQEKYKDLMVKAFLELIKPRTLITFLFYGTFCYLVNKIEPMQAVSILKSIVDMMMGYWFGSRAASVVNK